MTHDRDAPPAPRAAGPARPGLGQEVNVVLLGRAEIDFLTARVLFDRGRGLVLEASGPGSDRPAHPPAAHPPRVRLERGRPVLVVYATGEGVFHFRGTLAEVLTKTRFYVLPDHDPREMEKREYIRATLRLPAVLRSSPVEEGSPGPVDPVPVELSASGFRWFAASGAREGAPVWLVLGPPDPLVLPGRVLRCSTGPSGPEVAGTFTSLGQTDREALLRLVFRSRLSEMGVRDIENW